LLLHDPEIGSIIMWQGAIVDIPEGWVLCNGKKESPNLLDRMVVGSNGIYAQDETGGVTPHNHDFTADGHDHGFPGGSTFVPTGPFDERTRTNPLQGTTDNTANLPSYYSLAFIMFTGG
jgi:hypothetical protein